MKKESMYLFLLSTIMLLGCSPNAIKEQSARLDQLLIPIFYHVEKGNAIAAFKKTKELEDAWASLKPSSEWESISDDDAHFHRAVMTRILALENSIQSGDQVQSFLNLELIQCDFSERRAAEGISYYVDEWFTFKYDVDIMATIASDELLDLCEWEDLEWQMDLVENQFYFLSTEVYDLEYFEIEKDGLQPHFTRIDYGLKQMREAMMAADRIEVAHQARQIQAYVLGGIYAFSEITYEPDQLSERKIVGHQIHQP